MQAYFTLRGQMRNQFGIFRGHGSRGNAGGNAEAGRALTAEVASRGSGAVAGGGVVIRS